jgi:hypothetical protein
VIHKFPNNRHGVIYIVYLKFYISVIIISFNFTLFDLVSLAFALEVPVLNFGFRY